MALTPPSPAEKRSVTRKPSLFLLMLALILLAFAALFVLRSTGTQASPGTSTGGHTSSETPH